jgi:hypothetical protein
VTQDDEDRQLRSLLGALGVVSDWENLTGGSAPSGAWRPEDNSDLAEDDRGAHPYGVSHAAWAAITATVSHLGCLRDSLFVQKGPGAFEVRLHTHGQFTLVRGALDNASRAVWLLEPDDREVRLRRRLQQDWAEVRNLEKVREEIGTPPAKTMDDRFAELCVLAQRASIDPNVIKKTPDYTTIVRAAGRHVASGPNRTVVIWKACSSLAHGEIRGQLAYLTRDVFAESSPGVALARVTSNVLLLDAGVRAPPRWRGLPSTCTPSGRGRELLDASRVRPFTEGRTPARRSRRKRRTGCVPAQRPGGVLACPGQPAIRLRCCRR